MPGMLTDHKHLRLGRYSGWFRPVSGFHIRSVLGDSAETLGVNAAHTSGTACLPGTYEALLCIIAQFRVSPSPFRAWNIQQILKNI